ncbi:MAG: hypothetical protein FJX47_02140 [Alphaproteobacteria bacterium]|nr:hypothetical protein [Alphaproteobacteria bacterium]
MSDVGGVAKPPPPPPPPSQSSSAQSQSAAQSQGTNQAGPAAQAQTAQAVAQAQNTQRQEAVSLSPSLAGLTPGQQVTATVTGLNGGRATLDTGQATLTLSTSPPLPLDSEVRLQIIDTKGALRAQVLSINGSLPQTSQANVSLTLTGLGGEQAARAAGEGARAVVASTPGTALPAIRAGVQLNALVVNDGAIAAGAETPSTTAQLTLNGQVVGSGEGQVTVRTGAGLLRLDASGTPPIGTSLRMEVLSSSLPVRAASQGLASAGIDSRLGMVQTLEGGLGGLRQLIDALRAADPQLAQALTARLPGPNAMMTANMMSFIGAVNAGDAKAWLGADVTKALKKAGKGDLIEKLEGDFQKLHKLAGETPGGWQTHIVPMFDGQEVQQIRMFMKRNRRKKDDEDGANRPSTRVLVDLSLSALGDMQIDGMIQDKRFDMILRTRFPMDDAMQRDILGLYVQAMELSGMSGGLQFHVQPDYSKTPPEVLIPLVSQAAARNTRGLA